MITINQWMGVVKYRITEGSEYMWDCYGKHAYRLEYWDNDPNGVSAEVIYDNVNLTVFEATVHDMKVPRSYRWIHPDYIQALKDEHERREFPFKESFDDADYIDIELDYDWIEKARAIVNHEEYDTRIQIELNLPDQEIYALMKEAHKKDMSFNEYVEHVIENMLDKDQDEA